MLNYLDRGVIASNGVNGAPGDPGCLEHEACFSGSGIQYVTLPILVSEHLTHMQGLGLKKPLCLTLHVLVFLQCCRGDFKLSYFQDGVLSSAFMVGLVVASPIFANLSKK
jgi:hypothetical protein